MTEQQRQQLQSMDPQQRSIFIQKLQRDREAQLRAQQQQKLMAQRQQMMAQQSQQQQMSGQFGAPAGKDFIVKYFPHFYQNIFQASPPSRCCPTAEARGLRCQWWPSKVSSRCPLRPGSPSSGAGQDRPRPPLATPSTGEGEKNILFPRKYFGFLYSSPAPMSPHQQMGNLSPGHVSPNRMTSPVQNPGLRQAWSGEPHPALAQVMIMIMIINY